MPKRKPFRIDDFDSFWDFDRIDEIMEQFMNEAFKQVKGWEGPIVYGFSVSTGPDGEPVFQEFGNVKPGTRGPVLKEETEPLTDVIDCKDSIKVYAELPGVEKENIDIRVDEASLTISAEKQRRRYYKALTLPSRVKPDSAKASYKNGVLEICLEKNSTPGMPLKVE